MSETDPTAPRSARDEPKPCPFCGEFGPEGDRNEIVEHIEGDVARLQCKSCLSLGPFSDVQHPNYRDHIVEDWNHRPLEALSASRRAYGEMVWLRAREYRREDLSGTGHWGAAMRERMIRDLDAIDRAPCVHELVGPATGAAHCQKCGEPSPHRAQVPAIEHARSAEAAQGGEDE